MLLCAIIVAADLGLPLPGRRMLALPFIDKLGHFLLFGLLSWAVLAASVQAHPMRPKWLVAAVSGTCLMAIASIEEFSQTYIEARTFSSWDLLASCLGILAAVGLGAAFTGRGVARKAVTDRRAL